MHAHSVAEWGGSCLERQCGSDVDRRAYMYMSVRGFIFVGRANWPFELSVYVCRGVHICQACKFAFWIKHIQMSSNIKMWCRLCDHQSPAVFEICYRLRIRIQYSLIPHKFEYNPRQGSIASRYDTMWIRYLILLGIVKLYALFLNKYIFGSSNYSSLHLHVLNFLS